MIRLIGMLLKETRNSSGIESSAKLSDRRGFLNGVLRVGVGVASMQVVGLLRPAIVRGSDGCCECCYDCCCCPAGEIIFCDPVDWTCHTGEQCWLSLESGVECEEVICCDYICSEGFCCHPYHGPD